MLSSKISRSDDCVWFRGRGAVVCVRALVPALRLPSWAAPRRRAGGGLRQLLRARPSAYSAGGRVQFVLRRRDCISTGGRVQVWRLQRQYGT